MKLQRVHQLRPKVLQRQWLNKLPNFGHIVCNFALVINSAWMHCTSNRLFVILCWTEYARSLGIPALSCYFEFSVTRFGGISPIWRNFINLWPFIEGNILNLFWQTIYAFGANVNCCKWPKIEHIIKPSGHTDFDVILLDWFSALLSLSVMNSLEGHRGQHWSQ